MISWLSEGDEVSEPVITQDRLVAFVRGNVSGKAFERFAKYVPGVLAEYEEDFRKALESVANGEATFAIVPIENSFDGRLNSFYRLMEKYALSIVLAADIPSDDYESSTKFALVYKKLDFIEADGAELFECKITLREPAELADILNAAAYFGAEVCKVHSLPLSSGGRENSFDIIFGLDGANIAGLFCYLMRKYPHLSPVGLYTLLEVW
jgi:prephenate dehydratase